jgi:hypothetical protein
MADKSIQLQKEFVTIGFSIMDKIPAEYKEMFRSLLIAIDDSESHPVIKECYDNIADIHPLLKLYSDVAEKANSDNRPLIDVMKSFLLLFYSCFFEPSEKPIAEIIAEHDGHDEEIEKVFQKSAGKKPEMTGDEFISEIDKTFEDAKKEEEGDVISIDPKAIEKSKKKPGEGGKAPVGWTTW